MIDPPLTTLFDLETSVFSLARKGVTGRRRAHTLSRVREWSAEELGKYLSSSMRAEGIRNDAELARLAGLSQTQISNWRRGKARPSQELLDRVAAALRVPARTLYHLAGYVEPDQQSAPDLTVLPAELRTLIALYNDPDLRDREREMLLTQAEVSRIAVQSMIDRRRAEEGRSAGSRSSGRPRRSA